MISVFTGMLHQKLTENHKYFILYTIISDYKTLQICVQDYIQKYEKNTCLQGIRITILEGIAVAVEHIKYIKMEIWEYLSSCAENIIFSDAWCTILSIKCRFKRAVDSFSACSP